MADKKTLLQQREARRKEQERFLAAYDQVKTELMRIPGVVEVSLGLRERGGALTHEPTFRVSVQQKLPESKVPPEHIIPNKIHGFPTDVITYRKRIPMIGFDDENDDKNYKTKVGGIRIQVGEPGARGGTLGCFARLNSDNTVVLLSCHHVLMPDEFDGAPPGTDINIGVGQPAYNACFCCTCNEIAKTVKGVKSLDCAIARLKPDVKFAPKIKTIKKRDGTTELSGFITGIDEPVWGDEVWKVGAHSGLTRGTVEVPSPGVVIRPIAPFIYFADHGDSGSVAVNTLTGKVVALLNQIDKDDPSVGGSLTFGNPISVVRTILGITILTTDETQNFDVRDWTEERTGVAGPPTPEEVFSALADRLNMTERGRELLTLIRLHRREITGLINHRRPVTVTWHRSQGPAYMAALMRSAREPAYRLPSTLNGVGREEVFQRMREVLLQHGTVQLRAAIQANGDMLIRLWLECSTLDELTRAWEDEAHLVSP